MGYTLLFWRTFLKKIPTIPLLLIIWVLAFCVPYVEVRYLIAANVMLWLSAAVLAGGKIYGGRLLKGAAVFAGVWSLIIFLLHYFNAADLNPLFRLWAWMALGLHLMLAKSPLELAIPVGGVLSPFVGRVRAQKLALALALVARLIPRLIEAAFKIKKSLDLRAGSLPLKNRVALWGKAIMRDSFGQSEELARALLKRWPWG